MFTGKFQCLVLGGGEITDQIFKVAGTVFKVFPQHFVIKGSGYFVVLFIGFVRKYSQG